MYSFILYSLYRILRCLHADKMFLKFPPPYRRLSRPGLMCLSSIIPASVSHTVIHCGCVCASKSLLVIKYLSCHYQKLGTFPIHTHFLDITTCCKHLHQLVMTLHYCNVLHMQKSNGTVYIGISWCFHYACHIWTDRTALCYANSTVL